MNRPFGNRKGVRWAIAVTAAAGAVLLAVSIGSPRGPDHSYSVTEGPARPGPAEDAAPMAQSYSPYCQTPQGVCTLPSALPIGDPCECDGTPGRVVP